MASPYLNRRPREMPEVADMLRREIARCEYEIGRLEVSLAYQEECKARAEHQLDALQDMIRRRLSSDAPHWLVEVIDG